MNLSPPAYRNSFHPAWYLLILAVVPGVAALVSGLNGVSLPVTVAHGILVGAFLVPLAWWHSAPAPRGIGWWTKELRQQLPGCLLSTVVPALVIAFQMASEGSGGGSWAFVLWNDDLGWARGVCFLGCLLMAATTFGTEFEQRTLAGFLTQPVSRGALYRQKLGSLTVLIALAAANMELFLAPMRVRGSVASASLDADFLLAIAGILCSAPLFTLITRSTLAGAIFTVAVPLVFAMVASLLDIVGTRLLGRPILDRLPTWLLEVRVYVIPYFAVCAWLGWRQFARLEVTAGSDGFAQSGFNPLGRPMDALLSAVVPAGSLGNLVRKELRLHVVPWFVALILLALWALLMAIRILATDEETMRMLSVTQMPVILTGLMGVLILVTSGSACVAEERQLGTLDWQLTQPLTLSRQWWVKFAVALCVGLSCGVALPMFLLRVTFGGELFQVAADSSWKLPLATYAGTVFLIHTVAVYASSFSRSTMKATAAAAGMASGILALGVMVGGFMGTRMDSLTRELGWRAEEVWLTAPAWVPDRETMYSISIAGVTVAVSGLIAAFLHLASRNFCSSAVSRFAITRQLSALALGAVLVAFLFAEGIGRLPILEYQGLIAREQVVWLKQAVQTLQQIYRLQVEKGAVDPGMLTNFGLAPGAAAEEITEALVGRLAPRAVAGWVETLSHWRGETIYTGDGPGAGPRYYKMDPILARRYGLIPSAPKTNPGPTIESGQKPQ